MVSRELCGEVLGECEWNGVTLQYSGYQKKGKTGSRCVSHCNLPQATPGTAHLRTASVTNPETVSLSVSHVITFAFQARMDQNHRNHRLCF